MANDRDQERERRIREMMRRRDNGKDPNEIGILSQGQAEIQGIQDELVNNLRMQQAQDQSRLQTTGVMAQAAEGMLAMDGGGGQQQVLSQQVGNMNRGTQAIMQKYGVKPQNSQKTQTQNFRSSSGAGTMNVRNEYITNNKTDIKITQPQIPVSQPNIPVSAPKPQKTVDNTAKFKTWLSGMFARQQNDAEIQKKEYRKKEWNLARNTTQLMRKIEEAAKGMTARLDPQRMTSSLGGQLKWLLLLFGATMISKVWTPAMKMIANIEGGIRAAFGLPINAELRGNATKGLSVVDSIRSFIGIKPGEKTSLIEGIGKVITQGVQKLIDKIDFWFEDRSMALRDIKFPEMKAPKIDLPGFGSLMEGITDSLSGIGQYLGDLITVAMGGSKGRVQAAANGIRRQSVSTFTNTSGKQVSNGDEGLVKGRGRTYMRESDFGPGGILRGEASSTQAMSRTVTSLMNDRSNTAHTSEIATGVQQLFDVAKRQGQVVIDPEMLSTLGLNLVDINQLRQQKDLVQVPYKIIYVKPTNKDLKDNGNYSSGLKTGAVVGGLGGVAAGAGIGAGIGSFFGGVGSVPGAAIGGIIGGIGSLVSTGPLGTLVGMGIEDSINGSLNRRKREKGLIAKLVPANSSETSADGTPGTPKMMFALTKKGADQVAARFMSGASNMDIDLTNKEFYDRIRRIEERKKRQNGVRGSLTQSINNNNLREAQARYEAHEKEYYNKFVSRDPNSENMQNYLNYNTFVNNGERMISNIGESVGGFLNETALRLTSGGGRNRISQSELNKRVNYCMKFLMEHGLTKAQAAGIVGNLYHEGLMLKNLDQEYFDINGPSAGIAGFHDVTRGNNAGPGHLTALKRFAAENGLRWGDLDTQLLYLINGSRVGSDTINKIRQLTGTDKEVAAQSSFLWGKHYEVFGGKTVRNGRHVGYLYYDDPEHSKRRRSSYGVLETMDLNDTGYTKYDYKPVTISLSSVGGTTTISNSGIGEIAWIGDGHTCVSGAKFPKGVASGLGTAIAYFGVSGANAGHYLGANLKGTPSTNVNALKNATCAQALQYIIKNKPKYCIISLGHNGVGGLQKLINTLEQADIKVFTIKMWAIDGSKVKKATYSEEEMAKMYDGISSYGWVDLSWVNVEKSADGIHATPQGCQTAATETVKQLKTGTVSKLDPNRDAAISGLESTIAGAAETLSGWLGYNSGAVKAEGLGSITSRMTPEQKEKFEKIVDQYKKEKEFNIKTWEDSVGAVRTKNGVHVDLKTGYNGETIRAHLRTDSGHNALNISKDDIDWVEKYDSKGNRINISSQEAEDIKANSTMTLSYLFSIKSKKDKGNGYNDFLKDSKGKPMGFKIGPFKDLGKFDKVAQKDFGGWIGFEIFPSKDCSRCTMIKITKKVRCSDLIEWWDNASGGLKDHSFSYGPILYRRGARWLELGTLQEDKRFTDWHPVCKLYNVTLTPMAEKAKNELLSFLKRNIGLHRTGVDTFERADGTVLTKEEKNKAVSLGLLDFDYHANGYHNTSLGFEFGKATRNSIAEIRNESLSTIKDYYGKTLEDRQKYYDKNKDNFRVVGNKIIASESGVEFGTVTNSGDIVLHDDTSFEDIYRKNGTKKNLEAIHELDEMNSAQNFGIISRDASAKFLKKYMERDKKQRIRGGDKNAIAVNGALRVNTGEKTINVPYVAKYLSSGKTWYTIDFGKIGSLGRRTLSSSYQTEKVTFSSFSEMVSAIEKRFKGKSDSRAAVLETSARELVNNRVEVSSWIGGSALNLSRGRGTSWKLKDGTSITTAKNLPSLQYGPGSKWINELNSQIRYINHRVDRQAVLDIYNESTIKKQHDLLIEQANSDQESLEAALKNRDGNLALTDTGDIYGAIVKGENGEEKIVSLSSAGNSDQQAKNILQSVVSPINNDESLKKFYYKKSLGLKSMVENGVSGDYKKVKVGNEDYYVKIDTSSDISSFIRRPESVIEGNEAGIKQMVDGELKTVEHLDPKVFSDIKSEISNLLDVGGLTKEAINLLTDKTAQAAIEEAENLHNQELALIEQTSALKKIEEYGKILAEDVDEDQAEGVDKKVDDTYTKKATANSDKKYNATLDKINKNKQSQSEGEKPQENSSKGGSYLDNFRLFKSGGFTATGRDTEVAGIVHKNEWVASAELTRRYKPMIELLDKLQNPKVNNVTTNTPDDKTSNPESSPSYINTGGNVINSGNTTIINNGNSGGFGRRNGLSGTCSNDFGYNVSVGKRSRS